MLHRLTRLLRADMHALLDEIENPESLLKHSLREMEAQLAQMQANLNQHQQLRQQKQQQLALKEKALAELAPKLDLCFHTNDETLIRKLIRQRLLTEKQRDALRLQVSQLDAEVATQAGELEQARTRYQEVQDEASILLSRPRETQPSPGNEVTVLEDEVELALLAERQRRSQA
jgi:phage shock protein A